MPTIETIDRDALETVAGGSTVTSRSSSTDQLQLMLGQITSSISDLSNNNKNQLDPMMMIMMMMMMGGGGGGGGYVAAAPGYGYGAAPVVNVDTSVLGGGWRRRCGSKKGW